MFTNSTFDGLKESLPSRFPKDAILRGNCDSPRDRAFYNYLRVYACNVTRVTSYTVVTIVVFC